MMNRFFAVMTGVLLMAGAAQASFPIGRFECDAASAPRKTKLQVQSMDVWGIRLPVVEITRYERIEGTPPIEREQKIVDYARHVTTTNPTMTHQSISSLGGNTAFSFTVMADGSGYQGCSRVSN